MHTKALRYVLFSLIALFLLGLAWWYFFLNARIESIEQRDSARGLDEPAPLFRNTTGSTSGNFLRTSEGTAATTTAETKAAPDMWQISKTPVAGALFLRNGDRERLYFAERGTGYVFEADPETGSIVRLTNRLFPKTYGAAFAARGGVMLLSLDESGNSITFVGAMAEPVATSTKESATSTKASSSEAPLSISGLSLPDDVSTLAVNPYSRELFILGRVASGGTSGIRSSWDGKKRIKLFSSSLTNWRPVFLDDGRTFITQNAADGVAGFAYEVKSDGTLSAILRNIPGLSFLPKSSSSAHLWSSSAGGVVSLFARMSGTDSTVELSLRTFADKCVWAPEKAPIIYCAVPQETPRGLLDNWLRGAAHTSDDWWRVNVSTGEVDLVYAARANEPLDVLDPMIDAAGKNIAFANTRDNSLWNLRISENKEDETGAARQ
ncbi:MAG: hypothetical protein UY63_C0011G0007 [Parcubacteria group bacterium GW2011_GWA2_51_10]|nr:MAG: hypothetical protein UY63_C0011G0007 [Parcubacteria group bacterium GW2011_GWA2_51_10]